MTQAAKVFLGIKLGIVLVMFGAAVYTYPLLPDQIPMHWNFAGEVDSYSPKTWGAWMVPGLTLLITVLLPLVSRIDPRREKFKEFVREWELIQLTMVLFFAYLYAVTLAACLHGPVDMNFWMMAGFGIFFIVLGNFLGKIQPNYTVGIRVPWTIDNEVVWRKTHRLGGWCFVVSGLILLANAWLNWYPVVVFITTMIIAVVLPMAAAYRWHRIEKKAH